MARKIEFWIVIKLSCGAWKYAVLENKSGLKLFIEGRNGVKSKYCVVQINLFAFCIWCCSTVYTKLAECHLNFAILSALHFFVDLRKQACQLENEIDLKLVSFSKLGTNYRSVRDYSAFQTVAHRAHFAKYVD
jgi:hypothetical protein